MDNDIYTTVKKKKNNYSSNIKFDDARNELKKRSKNSGLSGFIRKLKKQNNNKILIMLFVLILSLIFIAYWQYFIVEKKIQNIERTNEFLLIK